MTRQEVLTEILRRAHREHGTCVLTLRRLEREITELRRYVEAHLDDSGDRAYVGYLTGAADAVELVEEALFEIFKVRPADHDGSWRNRLPRLDGLPQDRRAHLERRS